MSRNSNLEDSKSNLLSSLLVKFVRRNDASIKDNCSGHCECHNGICVSEIQFEGSKCLVPNFNYYIAFATVFFILALICLTQLIMCTAAQWRRMKTSSMLHARKVTTQKFVYLIAFVASLIRGIYFSSSPSFNSWSKNLDAAYYPLVSSGTSLIVYFWAEFFYLKNIKVKKPHFYLAFVVFNVITYSLLVTEVVTEQVLEQDQRFSIHIFNGCYAVLLFIILMCFLFCGIEVFFKVQGGLVKNQIGLLISSNEKLCDSSIREEDEKDPAMVKLFDPIASISTDSFINRSQLNQSRLGLLSQAFMLSIVVGFLFCQTLQELWEITTPTMTSHNWLKLVFRVFEIGVTLWFPCVLWNSVSPERLWILNPDRTLNKHVIEHRVMKVRLKESQLQDKERPEVAGEYSTEITRSNSKDCWICYDSERQEAGPLINPCRCRSDLSTVHHDCLRRWLVVSKSNADNLFCKICHTRYEVERPARLGWKNALTSVYWWHTFLSAVTIIISITAVWIVTQTIENPLPKSLVAATASLIVYICLKLWSMHMSVAYQQATIASLNISGVKVSSDAKVVTNRETVSIELAT